MTESHDSVSLRDYMDARFQTLERSIKDLEKLGVLVKEGAEARELPQVDPEQIKEIRVFFTRDMVDLEEID